MTGTTARSRSLDPSSRNPFDLLVIGGGTAGIVGAKTAARLGARVALVERDRTGGDCLWTGCVPSKALLAAASRAAQIRSGRQFGIGTADLSVDFTAVMDHVRGSIAAIEPVDSIQALQDAGVHVITGHAEFMGPRDVAVDGRRIPARRILLATGAAPAIPPIPGLVAAEPHTSDDIWTLTALPRRMVVLGGGSIGCELGQAFARLGADVTIVEASPSVLPREDPDAAALVRQALAHDGIDLYEGWTANNVQGSRQGGTVSITSGDSVHHLPYDVLVVATGRKPRTDALGIQHADIAVDARGYVVVDRHLRTTNSRVWAAGDLTPYPQFTHVAGVHASLAASNAVLGLRRSVTTTAIPRVTFTDPEIAAVGVPTRPAHAADSSADAARSLRMLTREHSDTDRAIVEGRTDGFTRLAVDRRGCIVGATIVGPRAGESIAEFTLAVKEGITTRSLASTVHAYPTYADAGWNAAIVDVQQTLAQPSTQRWLKRALGVRRGLDRFTRAGSSAMPRATTASPAPSGGLSEADASRPTSAAPR